MTWTMKRFVGTGLLLGGAVAIVASFQTYDIARYLGEITSDTNPESMYARIGKTVVSFLVLLLALTIGRNGINEADTRVLRRAFAGDTCFFLSVVYPFFNYCGVAMFLIAHLFFIVRNGRGFSHYLQTTAGSSMRFVDVGSAILIVVIMAGLFATTLLKPLSGSLLLYIFVFYSLILSASLWTGWLSLRIGLLPRTNALMMAIGMSAFFAGDFLVGLVLALPPSATHSVAILGIWFCYGPSIVLCALSGYRIPRSQ
jgi:hypothetical protein